MDVACDDGVTNRWVSESTFAVSSNLQGVEMLGVQDVVAKSIGSQNPYNMVRATFDALKRAESPRSIAAKRGKTVGDLVGRRQDGASAPEAIEA